MGGLNLLDERDRQRLSSAGSQERRLEKYSVPLESNRGSSRVTFGPDHWSALASVDARLEERRELAELYRRYEVACKLKRCQIKLKRVSFNGERKKKKPGRPRKHPPPSSQQQANAKTKTKKANNGQKKADIHGERRKRQVSVPPPPPPAPPLSNLSTKPPDNGDRDMNVAPVSTREDERSSGTNDGEGEELLLVQNSGGKTGTKLTIVTKNTCNENE